MKLEIKLKNPEFCDDCDYLHIYRAIIYAKCRYSFRNNYIHECKVGDDWHWIRPQRCIEREKNE